MELQDLKATWISMGEDLDRLSKIESSELHIKNPIDVKDTLRRRFQLEIVVLVAAIFILGTSRYWAPVKMPVLWISTFCLLFIVGIVATAVIIRNTSRIDLGSDSHVGIMKHILNIKRFYRNMELYGTISAGLLMVAGVIFSPVSFGAIEVAILFAITAGCFILEYFLYRSNIRKYDKIQEWL